jgi:hypothetical protein
MTANEGAEEDSTAFTKNSLSEDIVSSYSGRMNFGGRRCGMSA